MNAKASTTAAGIVIIAAVLRLVATPSSPTSQALEAAAATGRSLEFGRALLQAELPVGFVLARDTLAPELLSPGTREARVDAAGVSRTLELFERAQDRVRIERSAGTVHFVQRDLPSDIAGLMTRTVSLELSERSAAGAIIDLARLLRPRGAPAPGGLVGSGVQPSESCPAGQRVEVVARDRSVVEILDAIVGQLRGMAWVLLYEVDGTAVSAVWMGYFCSDGTLMQHQVDIDRSGPAKKVGVGPL